MDARERSKSLPELAVWRSNVALDCDEYAVLGQQWGIPDEVGRFRVQRVNQGWMDIYQVAGSRAKSEAARMPGDVIFIVGGALPLI